MKLSVVILSYNFAEYIEQCVDSALSQRTSFDFEILVCDDCSPDNSLEILKRKYSDNPKVRILSNPKNLGAFSTFKILLEEAKGEYISHIDGDDFFSDDSKLEDQVNFLDANPDYVMHATGYKVLTQDGKILPEDPPGAFYIAVKPELTTSDLLQSNLVTWGRTFRNIKGIIEPWMGDFQLLDWAFNFQMSFHGKIRCENWPCGFYRVSESGMFSTKSNEEKSKISRECSAILKNKMMERFKKITIIDCFVRNSRIEDKLLRSIQNLKRRGEKILLISNLSPKNEIIKECDYFIFDRNNRLLKEDYTNVKVVDFHISAGSFMIHNLKPGLQRHCLSVMSNLYNSLTLAKSLGYEYFQRIEVDDLFGSTSLIKMGEIFNECIRQKKEGCFYFNDDHKNISFHFFLSKIDFFLERIPKLLTEEDYKDYLIKTQGNLDFVIAEELVYNEITAHRDSLIVKDGGKMSDDFPDTIWNTETSASNIDSKYNQCVTGIYKIIDKEVQTGRAVLSYNYGEKSVLRTINCISGGLTISSFSHELSCLGAWSYHYLPEEVEYIEVFEGGKLVFSEKNENPISYISY